MKAIIKKELMKKISKFILLCFSLSLMFFSCSKDENEITPNYKGFLVVTTPYVNEDSARVGNPIIFLNVGGNVSFFDASIGVEQRDWHVSGGDILGQDNEETVPSQEKLLVNYPEPGEYSVRLVSSLDVDELVYVRIEDDSTVVDGATVPCIRCKFEEYNAETTLDTTFFVKVLDSVRPAFAIASQNLEAGVPIQFIDQSTGEPMEWRWTFEGASDPISTEENPEVTWIRAGNYDITLRASRPRLEGEAAASASTVVFEDAITIEPSSLPLEFLSSEVNAIGQRIRITFNQEVELPQASEFTITGAGEEFTIREIVHPFEENYSIVDIIMQEPFENLMEVNLTSTTDILSFPASRPLEQPIQEVFLYIDEELNLFPSGYGSMEPSEMQPGPGDEDVLDSETGGWGSYWRSNLNPTKFSQTELSNDAYRGEYSLLWPVGESELLENRAHGPYMSLEEGVIYRVVFIAKTDTEGAVLSARLVKESDDSAIPSGMEPTVINTEWTKFEFTTTAVESGDHYIQFLTDDRNINIWIDDVYLFKE